MSNSSRIFVRNRALGYVSNHVPLVVRYIERRKESVIVTCVGRHFHTYGSSHFTLLNVSSSHSKEISCLAADRFLVYTACDTEVFAWRMGTTLKHSYSGHEKPVHLLMPFGPHLLSVDEDSVLKMWDIKAEELYTEIAFNKETFDVTAIIHPSTYLNKVLIGSEQGQLQLWNMHTRKLIHTFAGWKSAVMVLEQAPAIDVVAVGLADGRIIIHNLRFDKTIIDFSQDWGCVTAITFRTDGPPIMVSGTGAGHVLLWDLEKQESVGQMWNAHYGPVTGLRCLPNEPLLATSSSDNSLKLWIFDMSDGSSRLLRVREGHSLPPTTIKFHRNDQIFTAGSDSSLRVFSTVTETKNHSYGRASFNRKFYKRQKNKRNPNLHLLMPPIIALGCEPAREKEWDDVAALHRGLGEATTWSSNHNRMGDHRLLHPRFKKQHELRSAVATCICLTNCGNFVVIGYSTGHVDRFNMQSGLHRSEYALSNLRPAHQGAVRGVAAEGLNQALVTGGADSFLRFWHFSEGKLLTKVALGDAVAFFCQNRDSSLLAVALDSNAIIMVDIDARTIVRRLPSHTSRLTALELSPDARWLMSATMDCHVRTWDIPSANLVDVFRVPSPATGLSLNATGELLATCHVNYLGVFLWCNRAVHTHISLRPLPADTEAPLMDLPGTGERPSDDLEDVPIDLAEEEFKSPEQISADLVTLSTLSTSRWLNVLDLDIVKKRNKPKEPPKAPKAAPFFLPTVPSLEFQFDVRPKEGDAKRDSSSHFVSDLSGFALLLSSDTSDYSVSIARLHSLGPSALDMEVQNLAPEGGGSVAVMGSFLSLLHIMLLQKKDFELGQTYLALFLKHHGEQILEEPSLAQGLRTLQEAQSQGWSTLEDKLLYCLSVVQAFKRL